LSQTIAILSENEFESLFKLYFKPLCGFSKGFVYDADAAHEIVQNVFVNLWQKRDALDLNQSIKSYLYTSVRNRSLNYLRDHKKFRSSILDDELSHYEASPSAFSIEQDDLQALIDQSIASLPEKCREVFELSRFEGLKYQEIADKLQISIKTVENQMGKALKVLREDLKDYVGLWIIFRLLE
jgi:RNA polymerase sigma-70 factor (ECF subfamily)